MGSPLSGIQPNSLKTTGRGCTVNANTPRRSAAPFFPHRFEAQGAMKNPIEAETSTSSVQ